MHCLQGKNDSACYKILYFTDSPDLRILHDSVTACVANSCELRVIIVHELARSKMKRWQPFDITSYTLRENVESVK